MKSESGGKIVKIPDTDRIRTIFNRVAPAYDGMNRRLSMGLDKLWRRRAILLLSKRIEPKRILDVAAGTGDSAIEAARRFQGASVTGIDISEEMAALGRIKVEDAGLSGRIAICNGNALDLPFRNCSFDAVTCAFGVRNFPDIPRALAEFYRVLTPGGTLEVLEFFRPENRIWNACLRYWLTAAPHIFARGFLPEYAHLRDSISRTLTAAEFLRALKDAGFTNATAANMPPAGTIILANRV